MGESVIIEAIHQPATSLLGIALTAIWLLLHSRHLCYGDVGLSYAFIVSDRQYWRGLTAQLSHIEPLHLIFNLSALWSIGIVERAVGSLYYLQVTAILILLSAPIAILLYHIIIKHMHKEEYRQVTAVGYSAVLFGWMTFMAVAQPGGIKMLPLFGLASIPMWLSPFASLLLTSLLFPRASFVGHLAGILAGYIVGFGALDWMPWWVALAVFVAVCIGLVGNYASTHHGGGGGVGLDLSGLFDGWKSEGGGESSIPFLSQWRGGGGQQQHGSDVEEGAGGGGGR